MNTSISNALAPGTLTVFNDSSQERTVTITLKGTPPPTSRELVSDRTIPWRDGRLTLTLSGEDVAVLDLQP